MSHSKINEHVQNLHLIQHALIKLIVYGKNQFVKLEVVVNTIQRINAVASCLWNASKCDLFTKCSDYFMNDSYDCYKIGNNKQKNIINQHLMAIFVKILSIEVVVQLKKIVKDLLINGYYVFGNQRNVMKLILDIVINQLMKIFVQYLVMELDVCGIQISRNVDQLIVLILLPKAHVYQQRQNFINDNIK